MRFPCRKSVGALVVILMALSSVAPLGFVHSHEIVACNGEHSHRHHHDEPACHHHCHAHGEQPAGAAMLSPHTHQHVLWWGLNLVLPVDTSRESGNSSDFDGTTVAATLARAASPTVELTLSPQIVPAPAALLVPASPANSLAAHGHCGRTEANLLCDTARLARSGVQLL